MEMWSCYLIRLFSLSLCMLHLFHSLFQSFHNLYFPPSPCRLSLHLFSGLVVSHIQGQLVSAFAPHVASCYLELTQSHPPFAFYLPHLSYVSSLLQFVY